MAAQAGLSLTWSKPPKTGFLVTRLDLSTNQVEERRKAEELRKMEEQRRRQEEQRKQEEEAKKQKEAEWKRKEAGGEKTPIWERWSSHE